MPRKRPAARAEGFSNLGVIALLCLLDFVGVGASCVTFLAGDVQVSKAFPYKRLNSWALKMGAKQVFSVHHSAS